MEGADIRAFLKTSRMAFSLSPTHFEKISGPFTVKKFISDSVATAFATKVFPHPGGPYKRIPFNGLIPAFLYKCGYIRGHSTDSINSFLTLSKPPISSQLTSGT